MTWRSRSSSRYVWLDRLEALLVMLPHSIRRRITLEQVSRCRDLTSEIRSLERFTREAAFAMHIGTAVLPVSSGRSERYRLNRTGNRKLNSVVHVIAVTQVRMHPPAIASVARKRAEGMRNREALRCLKRHIGRTLFKTMVRAEKARGSAVVRVDFAPSPVAVAV